MASVKRLHNKRYTGHRSQFPIAIAAIILSTTGCGTLATNADVSQGISAGQVKITDSASIEVFTDGPEIVEEKQRVGGLSCKNKIWDPAASEANAIALMKKQAEERGYNAVHSVQVKPVPEALALNCWEAIRATAVAFNQPEPSDL